jgi:hypothetical protein
MKRLMKAHWANLAALAFAMFVAAPSVVAADQPIFRDLLRKYYKDGDGADLAKLVGYKQPVKNVIALDYKVLLFKDGKEIAVDPKTYEFKIGDKVLVSVEPMHEYYVYIFQIGSSGRTGFLMPEQDEDPPLAKAGVEIKLPGDGFIEFSEPAGEETLLVVATEKPIGDRSVLAKVLTKKPGEVDTPQELAMRKTLKATVKKAMKSVQERQQELLDKTVSWRGLTADPKAREEMAADVKNRKVTEGTFEEPTIGQTGSTSAAFASETNDGEAKLLVSIPLKSTETKKENK